MSVLIFQYTYLSNKNYEEFTAFISIWNIYLKIILPSQQFILHERYFVWSALTWCQICAKNVSRHLPAATNSFLKNDLLWSTEQTKVPPKPAPQVLRTRICSHLLFPHVSCIRKFHFLILTIKIYQTSLL